jgi:hypothetical protein
VDSAQSILKAEGYVIRPSVDLYGRPLLALAFVGLVASLWRWRPLSLLFFGAGMVLETVLLFVYDALHSVKSFYLANKMFYLWLYPLVIFAALGLEALWRGSQRWWPGAWRRREPALRAALLVVVLVAALRRDLPYQPPSTVTEPVYQAGLWAKANLPSGCVDYLVDGWVTAYWLHVGVLGNRRESPRTQALVGAFDFSRFDLAHWVAEEGRPFAIVGDLARQAPRAETKFAVMYRSEPAAVVQRTGAAACQNREPPIEQAAIAPRPPTLASSLAGLLEGGLQLGR